MNDIVRWAGSGLPSILGERRPRIAVSGRIRPGIKVLTATAVRGGKRGQTEVAAIPGAAQIYAAGVAAGKSWDEIESDLKRAAPAYSMSPLTPRNVPYFTAFRHDFSFPEAADRLMDLYGEDRGEGRHLYRLPILFPVDDVDAVTPHALRHYSKSELLHWSEYDEDGMRWCRQHAEIPIDPKTKRARRSFGGRPTVARPNTPEYSQNGRCVPDACPEYQSGVCTLSGALIGYIPGIPGAGAIEIPTGSVYALDQMRRVLLMVGSMSHGRIAGPRADGQPLFVVTKTRSEVSHITAEGKAERVAQWIITLDAAVSFADLMMGDIAPGTPQIAEATADPEDAADHLLQSPENARVLRERLAECAAAKPGAAGTRTTEAPARTPALYRTAAGSRSLRTLVLPATALRPLRPQNSQPSRPLRHRIQLSPPRVAP